MKKRLGLSFLASFLIYLFPIPIAHASAGPLVLAIPLIRIVPLLGVKIFCSQLLAFLAFFLSGTLLKSAFIAVPLLTGSLYGVFYWPMARLQFAEFQDKHLARAGPASPAAGAPVVTGSYLSLARSPAYFTPGADAWVGKSSGEALVHGLLRGPGGSVTEITSGDNRFGEDNGDVLSLVYAVPGVAALGRRGDYWLKRKEMAWVHLRVGEKIEPTPIPASIPIGAKELPWSNEPLLSLDGRYVAWAELENVVAYSLETSEKIEVPVFARLGSPRDYVLLDMDTGRKRLILERSQKFMELDFNASITWGPVQPWAERGRGYGTVFKKIGDGWVAWYPGNHRDHGAISWNIGGKAHIYVTDGPRNLSSVAINHDARLLALTESYRDARDPLRIRLRVLRTSDGGEVFQQLLPADSGEQALFIGKEHLAFMSKNSAGEPIISITQAPAP